MRNSPTLFERRILSCLADHQTLSFTELRSAADARAFGKSLRKMTFRYRSQGGG
jgi:hypothetical protein